MFVSDGTLVTKTPTYDSSFFVGMPPMSTANWWPSAYGGIYRQQLWVFTVINKLARATARLPLPVYNRDGDNRSRNDAHPLARLLANPNPGMSGFDLWMWTSSTFDIYGEAFWYKKRTRRQGVVALYPLHPSSMSYDGQSETWCFDNGATKIENITSTDLVPFRSYDPDSHRGLSPLEPLRATLENEWHARNATSSFWRNGARPGVALTHPGVLSAPAADRLKAQWDAIAGGSGNTGKTVVLEEGMTPKVMTLSAEEAQYIATRQMNREEVCAAYDMPPVAVGILDHATFSNVTEQLRSVYRDTMAPRLKGFESSIETNLRRAEYPADDVYAEFLMDEVLRGDFEQRQTALAQATYMTIAEKRRIENLPFMEGTDRIFLNTATMPLDAIDAQAAALVAHTATNGTTQQTGSNVIPFPEAAARTVVGRLSWQKSLDDVDEMALVSGLNGDSETVLKALDAERSTGGTVESLRDRIRFLVKE